MARCGPSPAMRKRIRAPGSAVRSFRIMATSASGRFLALRRITLTSRSSSSGSRAPSERQDATSIAFGRTTMDWEGANGRTASATHWLTAVYLAFHDVAPSNAPTARASERLPGIIEWNVTTVAIRCRCAARAPANAAGDTTLTWVCTTSGCSTATASATARNPDGVNSKPNGGRRGASMRRIRMPSTFSTPGVEVTTTTSWSRLLSSLARSSRWSSRPPIRGRYQSQTSATFTSDGDHRARDACERGEHPLDLLVAVFGRHRHANPAGVLWYRGRDDRVAEDALVEQHAPDVERLFDVADAHRDYGRARGARIEAHRAQALGDLVRVGPQSLAAFGLVLHD